MLGIAEGAMDCAMPYLFERKQFVIKPVVVAVGNLRRGLDVIRVVVPANLFGELRVALLGFGGSHREIKPQTKL